jgi:hypothetical protein
MYQLLKFNQPIAIKADDLLADDGFMNSLNIDVAAERLERVVESHLFPAETFTCARCHRTLGIDNLYRGRTIRIDPPALRCKDCIGPAAKEMIDRMSDREFARPLWFQSERVPGCVDPLPIPE